MNFIKRWLNKRRKAVEIMVIDVMREETTSVGQRIDERTIVEGVKFSSWPDELAHKPYFIRAFEVDSALERLVGRKVLNRLEYHFASPTKSFSTYTFAFTASEGQSSDVYEERTRAWYRQRKNKRDDDVNRRHALYG